MSVYKSKKSPFYQYAFDIDGRRFHGSTKRTNEREALAIERDAKEYAKLELKAGASASTTLTIDDAAGRYWLEVGQHHSGADNTRRDLARLVKYFGPPKSLHDVTDDEVTKLVAWRRGQRVRRNLEAKLADCPLISPATVNRSTTEVLKKLFTRAKANWGTKFDHEPKWKHHWLNEPIERVRELHNDEADRIGEGMRADYQPFFAFIAATGLRWNREARALRWSEVNWQTRQIVRLGKGGKRVVTPITNEVRAILLPLQGHHAEYCFTYVAQRTRKTEGLVKGQRYPLTQNGVKTEWRRLRKRASIGDFRMHDYRHDLATKLLRQEGNLKTVQRVLNHADLKTTARYAHVLDDEVTAALDRLSTSRQKQSKNHRKNPRTTGRKVG